MAGEDERGQYRGGLIRGLAGIVKGGGVSSQLLRYAVTGAAVTALQAAVYWVLAARFHVHPQIANFIGYLAAVSSGYVLHGRFSFRGHGERGQPVARALRFVAVSLLSLGLNAFWVWLCVDRAGLPLWSPIPLMGVVTPGLVFLLNRQWVFR